MIDAGITAPIEEFRIPWDELVQSPPNAWASLEASLGHGPRNVTICRVDNPATLDVVLRWVPGVPCITEAAR